MKTQRFSTTLLTGNGRVAVLLAPLLLACTFFVSAQQDCEEALLFTILGGKTVGYERTQAVKPDSLRRITPEDVAAVVPKPYVGPYSARKFAPHDAFNTLFGDEDADNEFWESPLADRVDALYWKAGSKKSMRGLYISTREMIEGNINTRGSPEDAGPADTFRVALNSAHDDGQFFFFLREDQIRAAFNMKANECINVDAITAVRGRAMILLSFEEAHTVTVYNTGGPYTMVAEDGCILALTVTAWGEPVSVGTGLMVATEAEVNAMVEASGIRNNINIPVTKIGDLDGLNPVKDGGYFTNQWGYFPHVMFCGENLTGAGIVTTAGIIASINGVPMGSSTSASDGTHVGLHRLARMIPQQRVGSLNGLHTRAVDFVHPFVTEVAEPVITGGGTMTVDIEGHGSGLAVIMFDLAALPIPPLNDVVPPLVSTYFPETIYPVPFHHIYAVLLDSAGIGTWTFPYPIPPVNAKLVFQAAQWSATGWDLSTPCIIELHDGKKNL